MSTKRFGSALSLGIALLTAVPGTSQEATPSPAAGYAWAESCQTCHSEIYDAWAKTKHAGAWDRLNASEKKDACAGCHVTGAKGPVFDANGKTVLNRGVQCEACHGPAAGHTAGTSRTAPVRVPPSSVCEECHSDKSPKFKGFFYNGMASFSHKVK